MPLPESAPPDGTVVAAERGGPTAERTTGVAPGDFVRDTVVTRTSTGTSTGTGTGTGTGSNTGSGRYEAHIPEAWKVIYAFGGVSMAYAIRAIQCEVDRPDL